MKKRTKICLECKETFTCIRRDRHYCSRACKEYARRHSKEREEKKELKNT